MNSELRFDMIGKVAVLTIDRPHRANSLDHSMLTRAFPTAWERIRNDPDIASVLITAVGDRFFCTGVDMKDPVMNEVSTNAGSQFPVRITAKQNNVYKPVVCAVNGACAGGGLMFVADSDVVFASDSATFSNPAVDIGLAATYAPVVLARTSDFGTVLKMCIGGRNGSLDASAAQGAGIVHEVTSGEDLFDRALEFAQIAAQVSPAAVQETIEVIWRSLDMTLDRARRFAEERATAWRGHPDVVEGLRARQQQRPPEWQKAPR